MQRKPVAPEPWEPLIFDISDPKVGAIKALFTYTANAGQQQTFVESLLKDFCLATDLAFRPGGPEGDRATAFACGRQFVARQLIKYATMRLVQTKVRGEGPNAYPVGPEPGA